MASDFPGFAAVEQYGVAGMQGPWTDIYAFAATIYRTLVGNPPPEATARLQNDNMTIPAQIAKETPKPVLEALANALQVLPDDRTQSIDEMRKGLSVSSAQVAAAAAVVPPQARTMVEPENGYGYNGSNNKKKKKNNSANGLYGVVACIVTVCLLAAIVFFGLWMFGAFEDKDSSSSGNQSVNSASFDDNSTASKTDIDLDEKYALPDLTGEYYFRAESDNNILDTTKVKLVIAHKEYSDQYEPGQIISQNPAPNTYVSVGKSTIEVVVSAGPREIAVTDLIKKLDLIGRDPDSAEIALRRMGFQFIEIKVDAYDETLPSASVVMVEPNAGSLVTTDSLIILHTNKYVPMVDDSEIPGVGGGETE